MKLKFVRGYKPKGHSDKIPDYKMGEVYDFDGPVAETYARKYVRLGLAVEHKDEPKVEPVVDEFVVGDPPAESIIPTVRRRK